MPCPQLVVIGASAGGLEAVRTLIGGLPGDFAAAMLVVIHTGADGSNMLPVILGRSSKLPVHVARDRERIKPGHVYLPHPDCHLLLDGDRVALSRGPRQHGFRPAVDPLFMSAAAACQGQVIGVVLSGALGDGTIGLMAIKRSGGLAVVQNPEEAAFPSMPLTALKSVEADYVLACADIAAKLVELTRRRGTVRPAGSTATRARATGKGMGRRHGGATLRDGRADGRMKFEESELTPFVCPNCGGTLSESTEQGVDEYICHVGHRFSTEALQALELDHVDRALWTAVRALHQDALLRRRMAAHARERGMKDLASEWAAQARASEEHVVQLRRVVEAITPPAMPDPLAMPAARRRRNSRAMSGQAEVRLEGTGREASRNRNQKTRRSAKAVAADRKARLR